MGISLKKIRQALQDELKKIPTSGMGLLDLANKAQGGGGMGGIDYALGGIGAFGGGHAPPNMPPATLPADGVVPVDRATAAQKVLGANPALLAITRERAKRLLQAARGNPQALQRIATLGGAVMGAQARQQMPGQDPNLAASTAAGVQRNDMLQDVVSDKALPFLNRDRLTGLLGG